MAKDQQLERLARLYGIEPGYTDFYGKHRQVPAETERALLAVMGAAVDTPAEIAASLEEVEQRPWRRMLAPVRVASSSAPVDVTFTLPAGRSGAALEWRVIDEQGAAHEGRAALDQLGVLGEATIGPQTYRRHRLRLPDLPLGYHHLELSVGADAGATRLIVAPDRCFGAESMDECHWGLAAQLYGVRSQRNWGMGDFTDLARLAEQGAALGAAAVGVNPLHALFPADANHYSPYSPSSRFFLNVLYLDPDAVPDLAESKDAQALLADPGFRAELEQTREAELVDYPAVARLKLPVLERLFAAFRERHLGAGGPSARGQSFLDFRKELGAELERHCTFDALHEHHLRTTGTWSWQNWPKPHQRPDSPEVAAFAAEHAQRVTFFAYLQWLADGQLREAQTRARAAGMPIGLYHDIAVAVNPASAMAWAHPGVSLAGVNVGAPPDWFNPAGQNWALAPLSPVGLREGAYAAFITGLAQNMRHAGAVRIDHVMGLQRLYWIPPGASAAEGAYVRYPFDDLLRLIALESHRNRCLVIGEDLGTVPEGFRPRMQQAGVMSCRVLYFERDEQGAFSPPEHYPKSALTSVSTHDLPTLKGFWTARDIRWRDLLKLFSDEKSHADAKDERERDRVLLLEALERAGLLPAGIDPQTPPDALSAELLAAVHRLLARTPSRLVLVQLEDALGEVEQPNLPGAEEHPNWRRRLPRLLEEFAGVPGLTRIAAVMGEEGRSRRGRGR